MAAETLLMYIKVKRAHTMYAQFSTVHREPLSGREHQATKPSLTTGYV